MDVIRSKRILGSILKETLSEFEEQEIQFPRVISYCESLGQPTFKITIEKIDEDIFIDENGCKWVKSK